MAQYYMLHKPRGCVTARRDKDWPTVMDYFPPELQEVLHPIGRLDKDTEGLLLLTDDGGLDIYLLRPEHHVEKEYLYYSFGKLEPERQQELEAGVSLGSNSPDSRPARAELIGYSTIGESEAHLPADRKEHYLKNPWRPVTIGKLWITEGRKHQVKLMVKAIGGKVFYLKRLSIGGVALDEALKPGEYRALTAEELNRLGYAAK